MKALAYAVVILVALLLAARLGDGRGPRLTLGDRTFTALVADTPAARAQGLSDRPALAADEAMLFTFPDEEMRSFWMRNMRFAIDIIWIRDDVVIGITRDAQPEPGVPEAALKRYGSPGPADAVVEVLAGVASDAGIHEGDTLRVHE